MIQTHTSGGFAVSASNTYTLQQSSRLTKSSPRQSRLAEHIPSIDPVSPDPMFVHTSTVCISLLSSRVFWSFFAKISQKENLTYILYMRWSAQILREKMVIFLYFPLLSKSLFEVCTSFECRHIHCRDLDFFWWVSWVYTSSSFSVWFFECTKSLDSYFTFFFYSCDYCSYKFVDEISS